MAATLIVNGSEKSLPLARALREAKKAITSLAATRAVVINHDRTGNALERVVMSAGAEIVSYPATLADGRIAWLPLEQYRALQSIAA